MAPETCTRCRARWCRQHPHHASPLHPTAAGILHTAKLSPTLPGGRLRDPISFGGATGPLRLFESRLADQGSWILPFALVGLLAFALLLARPPAVSLPGMPFEGACG